MEPSRHGSPPPPEFLQQYPAARRAHLGQLRFQVIDTKAESTVLRAKCVQAVLVGVQLCAILSLFQAPSEHIPEQLYLHSWTARWFHKVERIQTWLNGTIHDYPPSSGSSSPSAQVICFLQHFQPAARDDARSGRG
jgi:hypothetical protein